MVVPHIPKALDNLDTTPVVVSPGTEGYIPGIAELVAWVIPRFCTGLYMSVVSLS